jgi:hypothetical protein
VCEARGFTVLVRIIHLETDINADGTRTTTNSNYRQRLMNYDLRTTDY